MEQVYKRKPPGNVDPAMLLHRKLLVLCYRRFDVYADENRSERIPGHRITIVSPAPHLLKQERPQLFKTR